MPHNICSDNKNCNLPVVNFGKLLWFRNRLNSCWISLSALRRVGEEDCMPCLRAEFATLLDVVSSLSLPISFDSGANRYVITF